MINKLLFLIILKQIGEIMTIEAFRCSQIEKLTNEDFVKLFQMQGAVQLLTTITTIFSKL